MTRILHCADLHLEASFAGQGLPPALARQRRADLRQALVRIVGLAREHRVDALTIAGDLYEQDLAGPDTGAFLAQQLATLDPIPVFIAPGDHDPLDGDALYALADWPANVRVFQPGPLTAAEVGPGVCLWGAAHPTDPGQQILAGPRGGHAGTNLLLLHAAWTREDGQGLLRLDGEALQRAGFAAALLGHEHQGRIWQEGAVHCVYPGSPEPLGWADAEGEHLAVLVTVDGSACRFQKLATSRWRYLELRVDISGCASMEEVAGLVAARLRSAPGTVDGCTIGRVVLDGMRRFEVDQGFLARRVGTEAHLQYVLEFGDAYDLAALAQERSVRGLLVRRFQDVLAAPQSDAERRTTLAALNLALRAMEGRKVGPDADR